MRVMTHRCFEFTYIGPFIVGAGLYKADEQGRAYLEGTDVAHEYRGISA